MYNKNRKNIIFQLFTNVYYVFRQIVNLRKACADLQLLVFEIN